MFRSLLVPLDGSPDSAAALPLARLVAESCGGSITLLHVPTSHSTTNCTRATSYLEATAEQLRRSNLIIHTVCRPGDPAHEILEETRTRGSDLIVMATRAPGPRSMYLLTSVARWVLAKCGTPLLLVAPGGISPTRLHTLLAPVDGSPGGSIALGVTAAMARAAGAQIELLDVVVPVPAATYAALPGIALGGCIDPAWEQEALNCARTYVDNVAHRMRDSGLAVDARIAVGDVSAEIVRCANDTAADLIVMSTHALIWPAQATVGSVADSVLRNGRRPVLLVRRESPAGDAGPLAGQTMSAWMAAGKA